MTTPARHPVNGQFIPAPSAGASGWDAITGTGASDTASARPPSYADALSDQLYLAAEADQVAAKLALSASMPGRPGSPGPSGGAANSDSSAAFTAAYQTLTGRT